VHFDEQTGATVGNELSTNKCPGGQAATFAQHLDNGAGRLRRHIVSVGTHGFSQNGVIAINRAWFVSKDRNAPSTFPDNHFNLQ
jgi:hypothetical protein